MDSKLIGVGGISFFIIGCGVALVIMGQLGLFAGEMLDTIGSSEAEYDADAAILSMILKLVGVLFIFLGIVILGFLLMGVFT